MNRYVGITALIVAAAVTVGCQIGLEPDTAPYSREELAEQLNAYRALLPDFQALGALAESPEQTGTTTTSGLGTSAVAPPWDGSAEAGQINTEWAQVFLADPADVSTAKSPADLLSEYDTDGSGTARIPGDTNDGQTGYIDGYYAAGDQLRFVLEDQGNGYYKVQVYSYPRSNFEVLYTYEEYYVASGAWSPYYTSAGVNTEGYAKLETHYADGSVGERTEKAVYPGDGSEWYPAFAVPTLINTESRAVTADSQWVDAPDLDDTVDIFTGLEPTNIGDYTFSDLDSILDSEPARSATTGEYSSFVEESLNGPRGTKLEAVQFYTEPDSSSASGVTYTTYGRRGRWATTTRTVSRSQRTDSGNTLRVLTTTGNTGSIWESSITETTVTETNGGLVRYESMYAQWWDDITDAAQTTPTPDYTSTLVLTQDAVDSLSYSGFKVYSWGGGTYSVDQVTLTHNADGSYTMDTTFRWDAQVSTSGLVTSSAVSPGLAAAATDTERLQLGISSSDGSLTELDVPHDGGTLSVSYEQGALLGTYTKEGYSVEVLIAPEGIAVDDTFHRGSDL